MNDQHTTSSITRRTMLQQTAAAGVASITSAITPVSAAAEPVNTNSAPSDLKITDIRACTVASNFDYPIIRIDTNQGVYGLGEVRDGGVKGQALVLKPHLVGRNPLQIEVLMERLRPYSGHARLGGGFSAVDMALHDIAGKVYGVPAYRLVGTKYRDKVRVYCDTTASRDPEVYARNMLERKKQGFTYFKMDLWTNLVNDRIGAINGVAATEKGLRYLCEYIEAVREAIGWDVPLATDHFGRGLTVDDCIRYGKAFEPYQLAWVEDFIDWQDTMGMKAITDAINVPNLTGENTFGFDAFKTLVDHRAVDIIHPDMETSGGILETKRIADYANRHHIPAAFHFAGSPVGCMASVHCIATVENFLSMENHAVDIPWWNDLVTGIPNPLVKDGYIDVPETPGLGVELNDDVVKEHLRYPGYFEPTPQFDEPLVSYGIWKRGPYPHLEDGKLVNELDGVRVIHQKPEKMRP